MPHAQIGDARLHYEQAGDGGSPILLVMGFGLPGSVWAPQVPALAARHRVAWYDNRGTGRTSARPGLYTMRRLAADALALMDHLGWSDAHVVGVSMGGMIAQELALQAPGRVRSLGLLVTHAGGLRAVLPPAEGLRLFVESNLRRDARGMEALQRLLYPEPWLATRDRRALAAELAGSGFGEEVPARFKLSQLAAVLRHRTARRLRRLEGTPTLVVKAARDVLVRPAESDRLRALIPGARLHVLPEAGHGVTGQLPEEVNALLLDHVREVDLGRG